jgi:hypothetical protein
LGGGANEVAIGLEQFGVGNVSRPGDWVGVRVRLTDSSPRERNVLVRLAVPDPDGDTAVAERQLTLNPGIAQGAWLYFRVPFRFDPTAGVVASVHVAEEPPPGSPSGRYEAGELLGRQRLLPTPANSVVPSTLGMLAVIGRDDMGLQSYAVRTPGAGGATTTPFGHESSEVATGLAVAALPDRWMGYMPLWGLVWGPAVEPTEVRGEQARAIREWVERGGHLVVVLPAVGQQWTNPESNELHEIMPVVTVSRREGVDMEAYRPLLQRMRTGSALPRNAVVHTMTPLATAEANEAIRVLNGPDGECVVARRLVGAGMVTLVGLDLGSGALRASGGLRADAFWHRVFGRRGSLEGATADAAGVNAIASRDMVPYDGQVARLIEKRGRAAGGVLLGFVVFIVYWLVAGPLGFALLRSRKRTQHAWMLFVAASGVFTVLAWGGATLLRPSRVEAVHVTMLDHVYGQPISRARTWASVLVPRYGESTIALGDPADLGSRRSPGLITAWDEPSTTAAAVMFPDARQYVVDATDWESIRVPARWTIKQVQADWSGGPRWRMPAPIAPTGDGELRLVQPTPSDTRAMIEGVLKHELPGALRDVLVVVVRGQSDIGVPIEIAGEAAQTTQDAAAAQRIRRQLASEGPLYADAFMFSYSEWRPGEDLDLSLVTRGRQGEASARTGLRRFLPMSQSNPGLGFLERVSPPTDWLRGLSFMTLLEPPDLEGQNGASRAAAQRQLTHTLDLGRWFTQPCVIVIGLLDDPPGVEGATPESRQSPVPIAVDGALAATEGVTVVRWVYPLASNPPGYRQREAAEAEGAAGAPAP